MAHPAWRPGRCDGCRFWVHDPNFVPDRDGNAGGDCHRYPVGAATRADHWCGEWRHIVGTIGPT